ncbi:hypothetical protein ATANTOWER_028608 [Ataeniobius toweri]|uniref:Uncharacterized protein n=1 Tax=Ataeniobius toweri TaxID=208326 RepID=A0ABU7BSS8_9TELE|nr:hypothetical protein [Ataeniobius toweri]
MAETKIFLMKPKILTLELCSKHLQDILACTIETLFVFYLCFYFLPFHTDYFNVTVSHSNINCFKPTSAVSETVETQQVLCRVELCRAGTFNGNEAYVANKNGKTFKMDNE